MQETIQRHHAHALQAEEPATSSPLLDIGTGYQTAGTERGGERGKEEHQVISIRPLNLNSTTGFYSIVQ